MLDRIGPGPLVVNDGHPLNKGRVAWWLVLPGTNYGGARWYDLIGSNHGTLTNMASGTSSGWQGASLPGSCGHVAFDGVNDYVAIADAPALNMVAGFTVCGWYRTTSAALDRYIFSKQKAAAPYNGYSLAFGGSGHVLAEVSDGTYTSTSGVISSTTTFDGTWHHAAVTRSGTTATIYFDGKPDSSGTVQGGDTTFAVAARIGDFSGGGSNLPGYLNDIAAWNRTLSAAEISDVYTLSRRGYPGVLVRAAPATFSVPAAAVAFLAGRQPNQRWAVKRAAYY